MSNVDHPDNFRYHTARPEWRGVDWKEVFRFRELIWIFAARDLKVRYRQTVVGIAWSLIQPLMTVFVFGILFKAMNANTTASDAPYAVTTLCGLLPWQLFSLSLSNATRSIVLNQPLVTKVYIPRVILPLSSTLPPLVDFLIAFALMVALLAFYSILPSSTLLLVPLMVAYALLASIACSLWLSALNALYRDVEYAVPFLIQIGLFASPIVYESSVVMERIPEMWRWAYWLNPMAGVAEGFRWAILGNELPSIQYLSLSFAMVVFIFVTGMFYFRRMERHFADRI